MKKLLVWLFIPAVILSSCADDEPDIENEEELITTVIYKLTSDDHTAEFKFQDLDGDGGDAPVITVDTLNPNTVYTATLEFWNEAGGSPEDITEEVEDEALEHQIFFASTTEQLSIAYGDMDSDGNPIGLTSTLTTLTASSGKLTISLIHEPNKDAENVSNGDKTNAGGETDIEVTFDVEVQ